MYLLLYLFSEFIAASVDVVIFVRIFQFIFPLKKEHKFSSIYLYCVLIPFYFLRVIEPRYTSFSMGILIGGIIYITFAAAIYYFAPGKHVFAFSSLYWIMIYLLDGVGLYILSTITGNKEPYNSAGCFYLMVMKILFIIIYKFSRRNLFAKLKSQMRFYYKYLLLFSIAGMIGIIYLQRLFFEETVRQLVVDWMVFASMGVFMISSFGLYNKRNQIKEQERIISSKKELIVENYNCLMSKQSEMGLWQHNMEHNLHAIYMMLVNNHHEEAKLYIEKMRTVIDKNYCNVYSRNEIIDMMLNLKITEAQKKQIEVRNRIEPIGWICIEDSEICLIISSLFNNAIEACDKISKGEKGKKWIDISIKMRSNLLLIDFQNSIQQIPRKKNHGFITSKRNKEIHGIGLEIVNRIVEKYNGCMVFDYDAEQFNICITLFVGG